LRAAIEAYNVRMPDRISRRTAIAAVSGIAVAPAETESPSDKVQKAVADIKRNSDRLGQMKIPMDLEPATNFHV